ncbi:MAG: TrkH family potassium uptake protein [Verrucomicrobiales bacterium]
MNPRILSRSIGILLLLLAGAMGACLLIGFWLPVSTSHNPDAEAVGWWISLAATATAGSALFLIGRRHEQRRVMIRKEAIAMVGLSWIVCSFFASLPYQICPPHLSFDRAIFESVSGLTTTGATVFANIEGLPKTILLWRSVTQWLGGMGILGMFVLVLSGIGANGKTLFSTESSTHTTDLSLANVRQTTRSLWLFYFALTGVAALGMALLGMTPFQAINHALTATATGGFGTENDSLAGAEFGNALKIWIMAIMFLSGISFPLYIALIKRRDLRILKQHEETWWYLAIMAAASTLLVLINASAKGGAPVIDVVFNAVSIMTSTGFVVGDYDSWPLIGGEIIIILMVIGGCSGSTAGGLKVSRMILWLRLMRIELIRAFRPKLVLPLKLNGSTVPEGTRGQLLVVLTMAGFFFFSGTLLLQAFEPEKSLLGCSSAVITSLCNIGPGFAEFGPTKNFTTLSTPGALMLPCLMVLGRLEYIAVLVLFSKRLWRRY